MGVGGEASRDRRMTGFGWTKRGFFVNGVPLLSVFDAMVVGAALGWDIEDRLRTEQILRRLFDLRSVLAAL